MTGGEARPEGRARRRGWRRRGWRGRRYAPTPHARPPPPPRPMDRSMPTFLRGRQLRSHSRRGCQTLSVASRWTFRVRCTPIASPPHPPPPYPLPPHPPPPLFDRPRLVHPAGLLLMCALSLQSPPLASAGCKTGAASCSRAEEDARGCHRPTSGTLFDVMGSSLT